MSITEPDFDNATQAGLGDLIRCRPDRKNTGFAPGGRVRTHQFGTNRSVFRGRGMEFDEARIYQPGDDVRAIDWRVTARTGDVHTKLYHEERERPVFVLLDCRRMMHFGTRVRFKSVLAAQIAATLCWVGLDGGDRVGGFLLAPDGLRDFPGTRARQGVLAFLKAMSDATRPAVDDDGPEASLLAATQRLRHVARPGSLVFIVSDFSDLDTQTEREIKRLSLHAHVTNIQITDQLDAHLPVRGDYNVSDGNKVMNLSGVSREALAAHERRFEQVRLTLDKMSRQRGMAFLHLDTSDSPKRILRRSRAKANHDTERGLAA